MGQHNLCFLCRSSVEKSTAFSELEQGMAFQFLCQLLNMETLTRLENVGKVENSEFCRSCEYRVREAMATNHEILLLQSKLNLLQKYIKSSIISSYRRTVVEPREQLAYEAEVLGRMLVQCWSRSDVVISPIAELDHVTTVEMKLPLSLTASKSDMEAIPKTSTFSLPRSDNKIIVETTSENCSFASQKDPPTNFSSNIDIISTGNEDDDFSEPNVQEIDPLEIDYVEPKVELHESESNSSNSSCFPDYQLCSPQKKRVKSQNNYLLKFNRKNGLSLKVDEHNLRGEGVPTQCPQCGLNFLAKCMVPSNNDHLPPYRCNFKNCQEKFFSLSQLWNHHRAKCPSSRESRKVSKSSDQSRPDQPQSVNSLELKIETDQLVIPPAEIDHGITTEVKLPPSLTVLSSGMEYIPKISTFSLPRSDNKIIVETTSETCSFASQNDLPADFSSNFDVNGQSNEEDDFCDSNIQEFDRLDVDYVEPKLPKVELHESESSTSNSSHCHEDDFVSPKRQRAKSQNNYLLKFNQKNGLSLKVDEHNLQGEGVPTQCPQCGLNFLAKCMVPSNNDHLPPYRCNLKNCKEKFFSLSQLWNHHRAKCPANQQSHNVSRSSNQPRSSDISRSPDQPQSLMSRGSKNIYCCEYCPKDFSRMNSLIIHLRFAHSDGTGETQCRRCKWDFTSLYRHVSRQDSRAPLFQCTMADCHLVFDSLLDLKRHHRSTCEEALASGAFHVNVNPKQVARCANSRAPRYKCGHCHKIFLKPDNRLVHLRIAHGVTTCDSRCRQCQWDFASLYRKVTRVGSDACEYECTIVDCGLKFSSLQDFKRHHRSECAEALASGIFQANEIPKRGGQLAKPRAPRYEYRQCDKKF